MMKYFTIQWWAGQTEDPQSVFPVYHAYLASVKHRLPVDIRRLVDDVSLHDSRLRRLVLLTESKELVIDLDGCGPHDSDEPYHALKIRLSYKGVASFESLADPEIGLFGPKGYGDLGYDEVEVLESGLFQHRMLFSNGIEFAVTFTDFTLFTERVQGVMRNWEIAMR